MNHIIVSKTLFIVATAALCCMPTDAAARKKKKTSTKKKATVTQTVKTTVTTDAATADSALNQSMTLERDFTPIVRDADKMQTRPTIEQPVITSRSSISFADWTPTPSTATDLTRLKVGRVFDDEPFETNRGWLDFAMGNYWNTDLSAGYYIIDKEQTELKVSTDWHFTDAKIESNQKDFWANRLPDSKQSYLSGAGSIEFTRRLERFDWHANLEYTGRNYTLATNNLRSAAVRNSSTLRQKTSDLTAEISFDNRTKEGECEFEAGAELNIFSFDLPAENREVAEKVYTDLLLPNITEALRPGLRAEVEMRQYTSDTWVIDEEKTEAPAEGLAATLVPFVDWDLNSLKLHLGARADVVTDAKHHFGIAPDVHAQYALPFKDQWLYADVTGGVSSPSVRTLMNQMPYFLPIEEHLNPWTLADAEVGYTNKVNGSLRGKVFVGAAYTLDALTACAADNVLMGTEPTYDQYGQLESFGTESGLFTFVGNDDDLQLKAGAELEYTLNKYFALTTGATVYSHSSTEAGSQKAKVDVEATVTSHPVKQLTLELTYDGHYDRYAWYMNEARKVEMDNISDLSLKGTWAFNKDLSVRAEFRNLLNEEQDIWLGIPGQKFNFQLGVKWLF